MFGLASRFSYKESMMSGFPQNSAMKFLQLKSFETEKRLEVWLEAGVMFLVKFMRRNDLIDSLPDFLRF